MLTEKEMRRRQLISTAERICSSLERITAAARLAVADFKAHERRFEHSADLAWRIQHEVLWGLANLGLDNLTTAATNYAKATDEELADEAYPCGPQQ